MEIKNNKNPQLEDKVSNDDIDLGLIFNAIIRNRKFIGIVSALFFLGSCLIAISKKRVWEGQFDIVISNKNRSSSSPFDFLNSSSISSSLGFSSTRSITTEVGILESRSVLMPAFEFVKKQKLDKYKNKKYKVLFKDWKRQGVKVKLQRGTTILSVFYRDKDKDLIIPVLSEISNIYQEYSGFKNKKNLELTRDFLTEQINLYKEKSKRSFKEAQAYAIDKDLSDISFDPKDDGSRNSNFSIFDSRNRTSLQSLLGLGSSPISINRNLSVNARNVAIEDARVKYLNRLKNIDEQIKRINEIGDDPEKIQYLGSTIPALVRENLPILLGEMEERLVNLRSKYTDNQRVISRLKEERALLTNLVKKRAIGYLEAQKIKVEANIKATTRPKEVLLKYKELIREAGRDESTLIELENKLRMTDLDLAKIYDPWSITSTPTMLEYPVAPSRKKWGLIGLLIGMLVGATISLLREKLSNLVIEPVILERQFFTKVLEEINLEEDKYGDEKISYVKEVIKINQKQKTSILPLGNISIDEIEKFKEILIDSNSKNEGDKLIKINSSFDEFINAESKILLANLEFLRYEDIEKLSQRFKALGLKINGILLLKNT